MAMTRRECGIHFANMSFSYGMNAALILSDSHHSSIRLILPSCASIKGFTCSKVGYERVPFHVCGRRLFTGAARLSRARNLWPQNGSGPIRSDGAGRDGGEGSRIEEGNWKL